MNELIFMVEEAPEGGFVARALGESIFTEADTIAELSGKVRDAVSHLRLTTYEHAAILYDVSTHFKLSREQLLENLFG